MDDRTSDRLISAIRELSFAHDLDTVLDVLKRVARDLTGADGVSCILRDGQEARYAVEDTTAPLWKGRRFPLSGCIAGWAILNRTPAGVEDVFADSRIDPEMMRPTFIKSLAVVPIRRENPTGALEVYWAHPRPVEDDVLAVLERLADTAVVAMANVRVYAELDDERRQAEARSLALVRLHERTRKEVVQREQTEEMIRQAQKMESLGRLAGGVSHDFNNVLTVIAGNSDLILSDDTTPEAQKAAAREIYAAAQRGAALTRQLLAFCRKQIVRPMILDLNWVIERMQQMLTRLIGENVHLSTTFGHDLGSVRADLGHIEQVIMNLVVNARDAMPEGGEIALATRNSVVQAGPDAPVPPGSYVVLAVADSGVGMDESTRLRVFEPFFTTKETGRGTGLGLSTVHGIVMQSGGTIRIVSEPGKGTTIAIYLPRVHEAADPSSAAEPPKSREVPIPAGGTVLVVEDESSILKLVGGALRSQGYTVLEASDGEGAEAINSMHAGTIDLMITDSVLPRLSGPDLCSRILARRPSTRVIFMSGYTEGEVLARSQRYGGAFLQKPFTIDDLNRKIRQVFAVPPPKVLVS
jgi:two-component system cell cycle sensor histidine kinase/response regulator CckA